MSVQFIRESAYKPPVKKVIMELTPEQAFTISRLCLGVKHHNYLGAVQQCCEILDMLPKPVIAGEKHRISIDHCDGGFILMKDLSQETISNMAQEWLKDV